MTMEKLAWHPEFQGRGASSTENSASGSWGRSTRLRYVDLLETAIRDSAIGTIILRGNHADDRIAHVVAALGRVDETAELIHAIGTVYSQKLGFGALAFLLTDVGETEEIGPTCVMRAISKGFRRNGVRPVVAVQYPHLLDPQTLALLAQMAYSRSILLVILVVEAEILPTEFGPVSTGPSCRELVVLPLTIGETHAVLCNEFSVPPTPAVTAEFRERSQGNPGLMIALAHDSVANGKLAGRDGYLVMTQEPWTYGGRVESVVMAQTAMLGASERKLLQRLALAGEMGISEFNQNELVDIDCLMAAGFVERTGKNRGRIRHCSGLLADVLRNVSLPKYIQPVHSPIASETGFYAFITGESAAHNRLLEAGNPHQLILHMLLERLRRGLLNGELDDAEQSIKQIATDHIGELPAELFEPLVIAQTILQVTSDCFHLARPALDALAAQLGCLGNSYDQWLVQAMHNFVQENEESTLHMPLPFMDHWAPGRWWFTELLTSYGSTMVSSPVRDVDQSTVCSRSELLMQIVGLRNGFQPLGSSDSSPFMHHDARLAGAFQLFGTATIEAPEQNKLAGLSTLMEAGFVVFALPRGNRILDTLSDEGRLTVAAWIKRRRKENSPRHKINSDELLDKNYPVLEVLTNREKMVATAAALGMNNQQIAADAGVSIRTVEGHLYQIYSKLALAGRRELSNLVESLRIDSSVKI